MIRTILCGALFLSTLIHPLQAMTQEERRQYLEKLLKTLPDVPTFKQWLEKTGEIPPDFDAFPKTTERFMRSIDLITERDYYPWKKERERHAVRVSGCYLRRETHPL